MTGATEGRPPGTVVLAVDSFKGSIAADAAADALEAGWHRVRCAPISARPLNRYREVGEVPG